MPITAAARSSSLVASDDGHRNRNRVAQPTPGPNAPRCPELDDPGDPRDTSERVNRPLIVVLAIAAVLTIGHFIQHGQDVAPTSIAQQQTVQANG